VLRNKAYWGRNYDNLITDVGDEAKDVPLKDFSTVTGTAVGHDS
jgi:hypothetical protein